MPPTLYRDCPACNGEKLVRLCDGSPYLTECDTCHAVGVVRIEPETNAERLAAAVLSGVTDPGVLAALYDAACRDAAGKPERVE